jgi:methionyl-tRNA synthetase
LVNHFLYLNGSKFSTSRRHAIWVDDVINQVGASSDLIRFFLAHIDVRTGSGNVSTGRLVSTYNKTIDQINKLVVGGLSRLPMLDLYAVDRYVLSKLEEALSQQSALLSPAEYRLHDAVEQIDKWFHLGATISPTSESYFWWLKGFALLAYPFMPRLSAALWSVLGYTGQPTLANFEAPPVLPVQNRFEFTYSPLKQSEVEISLGVGI